MFVLVNSCKSTKHSSKMEKSNEVKSIVTSIDTSIDIGFLDELLAKYPQYFSSYIKNKKDYKLQVIYTQVNRGANGMPDLMHHYFNVDSDNYFYPASTVKLPITILALQRLNELKEKGIEKNSTLVHESSFNGQTTVTNDPTAVDGKPSIAQYIKKVFLVSDNDAYNRLYEFLGQGYINNELHKKGYSNVQILHRLNIFLTEEENRRTNPVLFLDSSNKPIFYQKEQINTNQYPKRDDKIGKGYYKGGVLINEPLDFSKKNKIVLEDLHRMLISLVFPEKVKATERFNLNEADRNLLLQYMSQFPTESSSPPYKDEPKKYWQAYSKFLLFGAQKNKLPEHIRVFNKVGDAYGQLTDVAYIVDFKNKIEFFLSATIYCNSDGILNDDKYDYNTVGFPFMKNLGQVIYDYELKRTYKIKPVLSAFQFKYDK